MTQAEALLPLSAYFCFFILIIVLYVHLKRENEKKNKSLQKEQFETGLGEPASLHPLIDEGICIGCAACVKACPEQNVLGLIDAKAALISPAHCIGHGACKVACPVDAITLVFGTEKRGVDIPMVKPNFETNVPGIFIAGELGGMGLIRNAIEQGRQAMEAIAGFLKERQKLEGVHQVLIVGAGPAGFSASLAAKEHALDCVTVEQETLGGAVSHYPRGKIVMTQPVVLPTFGKIHFKETSKEDLLNFWQDIEKRSGIKIHYSVRVEKVSRSENYFVVTTQAGEFKTLTILLAIGRRGTPRKLGAPGEEKSKVVYRLIDPSQYRSQNVLVVGGGDSALEAALAVSDTPETTVTLSYRRDAFDRVKQKNRDRIDASQNEGRLKVLMNSSVKEIKDRDVVLEQQGNRIEIKNDAVIVCAGGVLPTPFLKEMGIEVETKFGKA